MSVQLDTDSGFSHNTQPKSNGNYRRPLVAAIMSACLPGFGQLYNGQANRAIWLFVAFCLIVAPVAAFVALIAPEVIMVPVMALWLLSAIGLWIWNIYDAWQGARRLTTPPQPWHMSGLYAAIFLGCVGLVMPTIISQVREKLVHPVRIVSGSMNPTLQAGDQLFVDRRINCIGCRHEITRGDVVVFTFPNNRNQLHIKRVIGLPGDQIALTADGVAVNGVMLNQNSADNGEIQESIGDRQWSVIAPAGLQQPQSMTVPTGHAYLLGDNRGHSKDSRAYGAVPLAAVQGKARQIFFSSDKGSINWSRIGDCVL